MKLSQVNLKNIEVDAAYAVLSQGEGTSQIEGGIELKIKMIKLL